MAKIFGGYLYIIAVVIILFVAISIRLYMMRRPGTMRAKCKKCGAVFDASRSISIFHIGPLKQLKCPACGKISLMNAYSKDPVTWIREENKLTQPTENPLTQEEEKKRIEESKYEKP